MKKFFIMTGRAMRTFGRMCLALCIWWMRFFWNAAWLMFSVLCAGMAMTVLMGIGILIIFLLKGYPFFGLFLICIGGLLCFGSLSMGAFSLIVRQKRGVGKGQQEDWGAKVVLEKHGNTEEDKSEQSEEVAQYE